MPRQYHFVTVSKPAGSTSLTERRLIHSYATQQAYGKRRRLRMQEYQQEISKVRLGRDPSVLMADFMGPLPLNFVWANDYLVGLGRPYSSQEHFLVDHYVRVVEPLAAMTCNPFNRSREHQIDLNREWLHLALTDKDLLDVAILLSACRSVLSGRPEDSTMIQLTMRYKQSGLQTLRQAIDGISLTTVDVAKAFALAIDEITYGEVRIARQHVKGVIAVVEKSGGPQLLGKGLLRQMYHALLRRCDLSDLEFKIWCGTSNLAGLPVEP